MSLILSAREEMYTYKSGRQNQRIVCASHKWLPGLTGGIHQYAFITLHRRKVRLTAPGLMSG